MEIKLSPSHLLVSETDERGVIRYANRDFCEVSEYSVDELLNSSHNIIRHEDMPREVFASLWNTVKNGEIWSGFMKNRSKSGKSYWVYSTVYPHENSKGQKGYLSVRKRAADEEISKYEQMYSALRRGY